MDEEVEKKLKAFEAKLFDFEMSINIFKKRLDKQSCRMDNLEEKISDVIKESQGLKQHVNTEHADKDDLEDC